MKHLGADERVVNSQNVNIGISTLAIRCWQSVMHQRKEKTTEKFSCDKLYTDYIQKVTSEKVIITDEKKQPTYIHIYVNYYSSVKQGELVQFFFTTFKSLKKYTCKY